MDMRAVSGGGYSGGARVVVVKKKQRWEVGTYGKLYVTLVFIETLSLMTLCVISLLYARQHAEDEDDADSVEYTSIVALVASAALLYFSLDSILLENIFQFFAAQLLHVLITGYVVWHYISTGLGQLYDKISLYVMIGVCIFQLAYLLLIYPVQETFGWRLYKRIGGNAAIRPLYRTASIFFTLLKLDFALGVLLVLLAIFYLVSDPAQIAVNVFAVLVTLGWLVLGFHFVQRESKRWGVLWFAFSVLEPVYIIYKLVSMKTGANDNSEDEYPVFSWNEFLLTGCVAVCVRVGCIVFGALSLANFGRGLREKMFDADDDSGAAPRAHTQHALAIDGPVAVVIEEEPQNKDRSQFRNYLQPLL